MIPTMLLNESWAEVDEEMTTLAMLYMAECRMWQARAI